MASLDNYYKKLPKHLIKKYHNPAKSKHGLNVPFRMLIVGGSSSGKTNVLMNLIFMSSGTFQRIVICCKSKDEPLYKYLDEKAEGAVEFFENGEVPEISSFAEFQQSFIVFDDLVLEKDQKAISEYFIRGRKLGISMAYLTQSYFKCPKIIRINCSYILIKKLSSRKDLNLILSDFALGVDPKELGVLYKKATADPLSFLLIDIEADEDKKFKSGFLKVLPISTGDS
jgi:hypothetical protein